MVCKTKAPAKKVLKKKTATKTVKADAKKKKPAAAKAVSPKAKTKTVAVKKTAATASKAKKAPAKKVAPPKKKAATPSKTKVAAKKTSAAVKVKPAVKAKPAKAVKAKPVKAATAAKEKPSKIVKAKPAKKIAPSAPKELPEQMLEAALKVLDERKAEEIVSVDLRGRSAVADYAVIASGGSARALAALAEYIREAFHKIGAKTLRVEGLPQGDWVLIDAGDILIHLFRPEVRSFYNLEDIWTAQSPRSPEQ